MRKSTTKPKPESASAKIRKSQDKHEEMLKLFDYTDTSDLPEKCIKAIKRDRAGVNGLSASVLELFGYCNELSVNMIVVGLYRKFGLEYERLSVMNAATYLWKKGLLEKNNHTGTYILIS